MSAPFAHSRPYDLGRGFSVEFKLHEGRLDVLWKPRLPYGRRARQLIPAYQQARNRWLLSIEPDLSHPILVVDI